MSKNGHGRQKVAERLTADQNENEANMPAALASGGEMGKLIANMDWSGSPLGPIESWPQSLLTTVSLCLASNFPISLAWGPEHVQIYNDGYVPICGAQHPRSIGQDFRKCWASAWPEIGQAYDRAWAGGSSFIENMRTFLTRNGFLEEAFFTFSFSPVRDETGGVGGVFHPVTEKTTEMLSERRTRALRDLAACTGKAKSIEEVFTLAAAVLKDFQLDLPFVLLYKFQKKGTQAVLTATAGLPSGTPASPELMDLSTSEVWPFARLVSSGQAVLVNDLDKRFSSITCGPYAEFPHSALVIPVSSPGSETPYGILVAGVSPRLALNKVYLDFYGMLASNLNAAVANAHAYEEERKRAEALAEIDRAKTAFFSNVSHEFRTPLTLMLGPLEEVLSKGENNPAPEHRDLLMVAQRNALRLQKLVNTLLDFSRIEAGRAQASFRPTDLSWLTSELASNFRSATEKAGLKLTVKCPSLPEPLYVDRDLWEKIVLNLLSNAFKHTFEGEIIVEMRWQDEYAEFVVKDTGIGIPPEQLPHLFERFHRVPNARSRTHEGSGIGLALVNELVRLHEGTISVESVVDEGTTFIISIPAGKKHLPPDRIDGKIILSSTAIGAQPFIEEALRWLPDRESGISGHSSGLNAYDYQKTGWQSTIPGSTDKARIILADDNTDMGEYVKHLLEPYCEIEAVPNGKAALNAIRTKIPDLILSDVMMPEMDGFELLDALQKDKRLKNIPVILISARAGEEAKMEGLQAGADDYLSKPFSARELLARVKANLNLHRVRREGFYALQKSIEREKLVAGIVESIRSETDLNAVLQKTTNTLGRFTKADRCTIWIYDSNRNQFLIPENEYRSSHDIVRVADTLFPYNPVLPFDLDHQQVVNLPNIMKSENLSEEDRQMILERGIRSLLHVPILYEKKLLGVLRIHTVREKREWDTETVGIVEQVAAQVAIAFHKAALMKELKESDALKTAILESSLDAIVSMDHQGKVMAWNSAAEKLFGYSRMEAIGKDMAELIIPERYRESHYKGLARFNATGDGRVINKLIEIPALRADGTEFLSELTISRIPLEGPPLFTGTLRDITERKQTELALMESEERFRNMADAAPIMIWMGNTTGENIYFNTAWLELTGRSYEDEARFGWEKVIHPDDLSHTWEVYANALKKEESFQVEFRLRRFDLEYRLLKCQGSPRRSTTGEFLGFVGVCEDITERRNAEDSVKYQSYLMQSITDNATAGLFMMDINGICSFMNPAAEEICGYTFEEIKQYPKKSLHDWIHHLHPDGTHYPLAECPIDRALPESNDIRAHEDIFVHKDGTFYNVSCAARPIIKDRVPIGTLVEVRDITGRKKAEQAIKESEEYFRTFANNIQNLAWMTTPDGHSFWYNQRWYDYTGTNPEEMQARVWKKVHHPDHIDRVLNFFYEAFHKGEKWELTFPLKGADGEYRWFLTRAYPVKDTEGNVVRWIGTNTNIDEQKRAEAALAEKNKELTRINNDLDNFIYTASHDLKAPILNIEGLVKLLNKSLGSDSNNNEKAKVLIGMIHQSIERFKNTIKDLTDIASVQSNGMEDLSEISFKEMSEEVKANIKSLIEESHAHIQEDFSQAPLISFSKKNLRSILYNLISNAIKYRSPDRPPTIRITTSRPESRHILLSVQDNGMGIQEKDIDKVFMMFKRLHKHVEGTGIGMAIVKRIIDNNGGKIEVDSEVGKGTTFKIYFKET